MDKDRLFKLIQAASRISLNATANAEERAAVTAALVTKALEDCTSKYVEDGLLDYLKNVGGKTAAQGFPMPAELN